MTMTISRRSLLAAAVCAVAPGPVLAVDATYPTRPITLVVPAPPGGVVDVVARLIGDRLAEALKTTVVIDNKPGAGGTLGAAVASRAAPDGYTLMVGGGATQVFGPAMYAKPGYDAQKGFVPVAQFSSGPLVVLVDAKDPAKDLASLIAALKAAGPKANYGNNGNGSLPHLAGELFKQVNGLQYMQVPYRGGPEVVTSLLGGDLTFSINHIPVVKPALDGGRLRALATTGAVRSPAFPNLPTVAEAGISGFEATAWFGLFAPAGTPPGIVDTLTRAVANVLRRDDVRARLAAQGDEVAYRDPHDFAAFIQSERERWTPLIKAARISAD
jgi:tripartite-type tricarboxylate transporter receptor subunit TctC